MIEITGADLSLETCAKVASMGSRVTLDESARARMKESRDFILDLLGAGERVYGVTTGFGRLAEIMVPEEDREDLQHNLIRSHSSGVGDPMNKKEVRIIMLLRANSLARGHSGCRGEVVDLLIDFLNRGIHPVVPQYGSVGASGDLAPLAHIGLALIGEGDVEYQGQIRPTAEILDEVHLVPLKLKEKEGLALINGTQATTGLGILTFLGAQNALDTAEVTGCMSLEALRGTPDPFMEEVQHARPHPGQIESAAKLRRLLQNSEIRESHREGDSRVQDPYCLRCMPQVHGATRNVMKYVEEVLQVEANSTTDNPLIFTEIESVVSAGNFHAQIVSQALDFLSISLTDMAAISERRIERMLNPDVSGLPAFLAPRPGLESGFMIVHVTVVDLLSEMRVLSHPASVDSVPTSAGQEDHVSMGLTSARKASRILRCLEYILAIESLVAAEGIQYHRPMKAGDGVEKAHRVVREYAASLETDRSHSKEIEKLREVVGGGAFAAILQADEV
jgi:histidine ammonia-lyase|tara:strand:+ start:3406 stop:4923 length:1518 start_codon:yes stop_codon:yes gene_type:complete